MNQMSETRDPAIKLFGKTIAVPTPEDITSALADDQDHPPSSLQTKMMISHEQGEEEEDEEEEKDIPNKRNENEDEDEDQVTQNAEEDSIECDTYSVINENPPKTPSIEKEITTGKATKKAQEEESETTSIAKEKAIIKKPDKILPCPRCNSLDTKFCYYNNYNVNQPRHFCKKCQRYWTAGGTMRNVPVGAGRRKNKSSAPHARHITASEALGTHMHNPPIKPNGTILSFGMEVDAPLCESMASVLKIAKKNMQGSHRNGFHAGAGAEAEAEAAAIARFSVPCGNGEEHSGGSSAVLSSTEEGNRLNLQEPATHNCHHGFPTQIPYFPGAPWNYPWNSAQWSSPLPPPLPAAFCGSSFPMSFYPTGPYWGCHMPGTWSVPWPPPLSSSPNTGSSVSASNSPSLGKHSREGNACDHPEKTDASKQGNSERGVWIPKTLRIDDPDEAAKSSIWATLGIKNDKSDGTIKGAGLFKAFQPKTDEKNHTMGASQVLHANPAAMSRSRNFHESS
ncbi:hypothetical protein AAC387_Pa11g2295 [Persea americana]